MFDGMTASAFTFQREAFADAIGEARLMLDRQWTEAGEIGVGSFRLAEDRYVAADSAGLLRVFTARHHGMLVGYVSLFVIVGMHAEARCAVSDALYILPEFRRPMVSMRLVRFAEDAICAEGVKLIHMNANERFPGFGRMLEHMGYGAISRTYAKVLNHA
jgi:GNAT superfamily N-acetyltransferase